MTSQSSFRTFRKSTSAGRDDTLIPIKIQKISLAGFRLFRGDVQMTSALRGREGVSQILTKGREVA